MLGTKRRNVSFSSKSDDTPFQNKRLTAESAFGVQAAAQTETATEPPLERRKAARQHVRALNTEFASWVQSQLSEHPDELWEDGLKDYLAHASDLLEKFTDVVNWLKSNTGSGGSSVSISGTQNTEKINEPETKKRENPFSGSFLPSTPSSNNILTISSSSGAFSTSIPVQGTSSTSLFSFGLSSSSQALSQSSSAGLATSWNPSTFSNSQSVSPVKNVSFSSSPGSGISCTDQLAFPVVSFTSSANSGLFSTNKTSSSSTTPSFTSSWNSGALTNSQTTFSFGGNQNSAPSNHNATEETPEVNEPEQPSSPSVRSSEEKDTVVVHETKCKLYLKSTDPAGDEPWKDRGTGKLFIKCQEGFSKGTKESKPRILVRNDVGKIMLNASLYPGIKTNLQKNSIVAIFHTTDDSSGDSGNVKTVAHTFLIRIKNEEERNKLADAIREHAPAA